jgi:hypothetical protein
MRKLSKAGGIALLILGLLVLGVSYYVKTDADNGFNQCGNILGAVVGFVKCRSHTF